MFKGPLKNQFVVTAVVLRLHRASAGRPANVGYGAIRETLAELGIEAEPTPRDVSEAVVRIRRAKLPDPAEIGNAGSFFKNPELSQGKFDELKSPLPWPAGLPPAGRREGARRLAHRAGGLQGLAARGGRGHPRRARPAGRWCW